MLAPTRNGLTALAACDEGGLASRRLGKVQIGDCGKAGAAGQIFTFKASQGVLCYRMDQMYMDSPVLPYPGNLVGTWRRFGIAGPVYEVVGTGHLSPGGDRLMRVRVVETGEEIDYRLSEILDDPRER